MLKKLVKFLLTVTGIALSAFAIFQFYKRKKEDLEENEFSDMFEDEDCMLD